MSPKSNDYLGEVIATCYLVFLGLVFSHVVPAFFPKTVSSLTLFQIGFAFAFLAVVIVRKTTYDLTALAVSVLGMAINDFGLRIATDMSTEQWWFMLSFVQGLPVATVMIITHIRDGIFERSPVI